MTNILQVFDSLSPSVCYGQLPSDGLVLTVAGWKRNYIAKSIDGCPVILIKTKNLAGTPPAALQLKNLTIFHGFSGVLETTDGAVTGVYSIIECRANEPEIINSFLNLSAYLLGGLADMPEPREVAIEVRKLVRIFQALSKPPVESIQGLWAELFVILCSSDIKVWVSAWHDDVMERYDFAMSELRVEVKSSGYRIRDHKFSHEQLHPPSGIKLWIASVFVERSSAGSDCIELIRRLQNRLSAEEAFKIESIAMTVLGTQFDSVTDYKFDEQLAADSLRFFPVEEVPRVPDEFPDGVSKLKYSVLMPETSKAQKDHPSK